jgi:hypothetical protein
VYSTAQRQQQYNSIKNSGLNRTDYRSAIKKLNQTELKYRTAQKLKQNKQLQAEKEKALRSATIANEQAKIRQEIEKKKKTDKNKRRRERNANNKAEAKRKAELAKQQSYINEIISNMRSRVDATYSFKDGENVGLSNRQLLALIAKNSDNGMWRFQINNSPEFYTLSDNTRTRIAKLLESNITEESSYIDIPLLFFACNNNGPALFINTAVLLVVSF